MRSIEIKASACAELPRHAHADEKDKDTDSALEWLLPSEKRQGNARKCNSGGKNRSADGSNHSGQAGAGLNSADSTGRIPVDTVVGS